MAAQSMNQSINQSTQVQDWMEIQYLCWGSYPSISIRLGSIDIDIDIATIQDRLFGLPEWITFSSVPRRSNLVRKESVFTKAFFVGVLNFEELGDDLVSPAFRSNDPRGWK